METTPELEAAHALSSAGDHLVLALMQLEKARDQSWPRRGREARIMSREIRRLIADCRDGANQLASPEEL